MKKTHTRTHFVISNSPLCEKQKHTFINITTGSIQRRKEKRWSVCEEQVWFNTVKEIGKKSIKQSLFRIVMEIWAEIKKNRNVHRRQNS